MSKSKKIEIDSDYLETLERQSKQLASLQLEFQQFVKVISHDLRAPLRGIVSLLRMVEEDNPDLDKSIALSLSRVKDQAADLYKLIDAVVVFSRVGQEVGETPNDLNTLLSRLQSKLENPNQVRFEIKDLPTIVGNTQQLELLFMQLLDNALYYNHQPMGEGWVTIHSENPSEDMLEIVIRDNGPGIRAGMEEEVFLLFRKAYTTLEEKKESPGIGLTIAKKLVEMNGGSIWINPEYKEGCEVRFTWPVG